MLGMQYNFALPADYQMSIIRDRVAQNGAKFDDFPGLLLKAFVCAEKTGNADENVYAPFYLWRDAPAMNGFLTGASFTGVTQAFGWPAVDLWSMVASVDRPPLRRARIARKHVRRLGAYASMAEVAADLEAEVNALTGSGGAALAAAGFDPTAWRSVVFSLYETYPAPAAAAPGDDLRSYEVLHLSGALALA